jgi:hypothetical protein
MDRLRPLTRVYVRCHGGQETIFEYEIDREGRNRDWMRSSAKDGDQFIVVEEKTSLIRHIHILKIIIHSLYVSELIYP